MRSVLLSGLETVAFPPDLLHSLEVFQMKCLRRLACGQACLKEIRVAEDGASSI